MHELWQFLTSDTAPWWASLLGVAVGSAATYLLSKAADRRKFAREDETQFRDRLLDIVADYLEAWRTMLERRPTKGHSDNEQRIRERDDQFSKMMRAEQLLELLAADFELASKAGNATSRLDEYCDPDTNLAPERDHFELRRLQKEAFAARDEFLVSARQALGYKRRWPPKYHSYGLMALHRLNCNNLITA